MKISTYSIALIGVSAAVALVSAAPGSAPSYKAPRTVDGHPDLQGTWNFSSNVPLERPSKFAGRKTATREEIDQYARGKDAALKMVATFAPVEAIGIEDFDHISHVEDLRTSLVTYPEDGKLPMLREGVNRQPSVDQILEALSDTRGGIPPALAGFLMPQPRESHENFGAAERCLIGAPSAPIVPDLDNNYLQIIQSKTTVALLSDTDRRIAPLDGRPPLSKNLRAWSGDARAHWDGETLVVETGNFNNRTRSFSGAGLSAQKTVTERFTRRSAKILDYEATVVDPATFTDKVVIAFPMALMDARIYENACHEHNYSLANALSAARKAEQTTKEP